MTLYELFGTIEIGLVFAIVALGAYLSFQTLDFPDLTVEGTGNRLHKTMPLNHV